MLFNKNMSNELVRHLSDERSRRLYLATPELAAPANTDCETDQGRERVPRQHFATKSPRHNEDSHFRPNSKNSAALEAARRVFSIWLNLPHPYYLQGEILERAGITSGSKQAQTKRVFRSHGLIREHRLQIRKTYACIWEPLDKAYEHVGIEKPHFRSKGGYLHQFIAHHVAAWGMSQGYKTDIEYLLSNYKAVDVALKRDKDLILIEIAISPPLEKELLNIEKDFSSGSDISRLVMVTRDSKTKIQLQQLINSATELASFQDKIAVVLAGNFLTKQGGTVL